MLQNSALEVSELIRSVNNRLLRRGRVAAKEARDPAKEKQRRRNVPSDPEESSTGGGRVLTGVPRVAPNWLDVRSSIYLIEWLTAIRTKTCRFATTH